MKRMSLPDSAPLRVWWIPQIPMTEFRAPVQTIAEAAMILDTLARYDAFQFEHNIKPDYANTGGLQVFDACDTGDGPDGSWVEWCDDVTGDDIHDWAKNQRDKKRD